LPIDGMSISLLTKFVGDQYMSNIQTKTSKLDSYFVNDVSIHYEFPVKRWFKSVGISLLANNIFNVKYISNGYYWTDVITIQEPGLESEKVKTIKKTIDGAGYYPQAEFNILAGLNLKF
jgi:iron complex outermembrane receptor protein